MSINKKDKFNKRDIQIADFAESLSHPARISILTFLSRMNTCFCGEIVDMLPLAQSTVSQHLNKLKKAGLIIGEIDGPKSCYCINWEKLNAMADLFSTIIKDLQKSEIQKNCCKQEKS